MIDWSATADGMLATATYLPSSGEYEVVVTLGGQTLREKVPATHEPRFGVDADDVVTIAVVAEKLAQQLEKGLG